jgi:hypothetical protein
LPIRGSRGVLERAAVVQKVAGRRRDSGSPAFGALSLLPAISQTSHGADREAIVLVRRRVLSGTFAWHPRPLARHSNDHHAPKLGEKSPRHRGESR